LSRSARLVRLFDQQQRLAILLRGQFVLRPRLIVSLRRNDLLRVQIVGAAEIRRRQIGFIFQRFNLISVLDGRANVELSLRLRGLSPAGRIEPMLEAMGVADVASRKPGNLSIGQQQRLAVARAMAHEPAILLADEPTGSLDSRNAAELLKLLQQANAQRNQTIVMITHSREAASAASRVVTMKDGVILGQQP
jgi:putative ABC transport system ATP-binding protein